MFTPDVGFFLLYHNSCYVLSCYVTCCNMNMFIGLLHFNERTLNRFITQQTAISDSILFDCTDAVRHSVAYFVMHVLVYWNGEHNNAIKAYKRIQDLHVNYS